MCIFVTATASDRIAEDRLQKVLRSNDFAYTPISNVSIQEQLPSGQRYFRITQGTCDCGLLVGSGDTLAHKPFDESKIRRRARKGNWSEAKLSRALTESKHLHDNRDQSRFAAAQTEAAKWHDALRKVMSEGVSPLGILIHFYRTTLEKEVVSLKQVVHRAIETFDPLELPELEHDVLYVFGARSDPE